MAYYEECGNSLPYIDDTQTEDEISISQSQYNLKIIENYQDRNRNIEVTNDDVTSKSLSPVAPLAEEAELSDSRMSDSQEEEPCKHVRSLVPKPAGMKLVIKGWNSTVRIQSLDNKSSITLRRRNERMRQEKAVGQRIQKLSGNSFKCDSNAKAMEKTKKGKWKMLTRSLISKTARFERRGLDERYPKYVLLKNEDEELAKEEDSFPKMVIFNEKKTKQLKTLESEKQKENLKSEFSLKKSFKNKTKPIVSMEELLAKSEKVEGENKIKMENKIGKKQKKPLTQRSFGENKNTMVKKETVMERSFSPEKILTSSQPTGNESEMVFNFTGCSPCQGQVFNEIQGIFEETLNLYPEVKRVPMGFIRADVKHQLEDVQSQSQSDKYYTSVPPQFSQLPCHDPCCNSTIFNQPPVYTPVYNPYNRPQHLYKNSITQTNEKEFRVPSHIFEDGLKQEEHDTNEKEVNLQNLPFGILSSFFPRVVVMKTYQSDNPREKENVNEMEKKEERNDIQPPKTGDENSSEDEVKTVKTLEVPLPDLTIKSKLVSSSEPEKTEDPPGNLYGLDGLALNEASSSDDELKAKTGDSEATEYLYFHDNEFPDESTKPTVTLKTRSKSESQETGGKNADEKTADDDDNDLSLTKIGYKMYNNLTKLSLKHEKESNEKPEVSGCGFNGNGTKKSPYNITLESNNRMVKVTVPENELNFQIVNSGGPDIQIGVSTRETQNRKDDVQEKKIVRRNELWHPDNGRKGPEMLDARWQKIADNLDKDSPSIKLSLANDKEVVFSIQMDERDKGKESSKENLTREVKVGTDDFELAGGDFISSFGANYNNLSPRTGQLLKNLHEKLEFGERERKLLQAKINEKLTEQNFDGGNLPGIFLVKQISPRKTIPKKSSEVPSLRKLKKVEETRGQVGKLREYYCEECLATMRIFEDENPSVKRMVDKFETIIQLESY